MIYYDDLDQKYKGNNINFVGKIKALSKEKQQQLKDLDYFSDEDKFPQRPSIANHVHFGKAKKANKFLEE